MEVYQLHDTKQSTGQSSDCSMSVIQDWQRSCHRIKTELLKLNETSEKSFLEMGNRFLNFSHRGKQISELSRATTGLFSSEQITNTIDNLYELLDRIGRYLRYNESELVSNSAILGQILVAIKTIHHPFEQFEKLVRKLHFLGISTRIESSRLNHADKSFDTLSNDVKSLSTQIETKLTRIIEGSAELRKTIERTLNQSIKLKSQQFKQAEQILSNTDQCLKMLTSTNDKSLSGSHTLTQQADVVKLHIDEIVQSMQFQDIIRQKLEHVMAAIDDIVTLINSKPQDDAEKGECVLDVSNISYLQSEQINTAKIEIVTAVSTISEGSRGIAESLDRMISQTQSLLSVSEVEKSSTLNIIETDIGHVTQMLRANAHANSELNKAMTVSTQMVDNMADFVADIHKIGYQIELIALNGIVNAAHIGSEGAALSVLADGIQRLSADAQMHIKTVSSILTDIIAFSDKLSVGLSDDQADDNLEDIVAEMVLDLNRLLDTIRSVYLEVENNMKIISSNGKNLTQDISAFAKSIQIDQAFSETLTEAAEQLIAISSAAAAITPNIDAQTRALRLEKMKERYTMHSEHAIHQALFESPSENVEAFIETPGNDADKLGDNIEFF
jgi:methyl-accepting chemotaxis protein